LDFISVTFKVTNNGALYLFYFAIFSLNEEEGHVLFKFTFLAELNLNRERGED